MKMSSSSSRARGGGALTPGVELPGIRPPVVHELVASLAQSLGSSVCG